MCTNAMMVRRVTDVIWLLDCNVKKSLHRVRAILMYIIQTKLFDVRVGENISMS